MNQALQEDIDFLEHFGIKGQKWGVRREARKDVRSLSKIHKKGGKGSKARYADAKKQIEERSARDPVYAKSAKREKNKVNDTGTKILSISAKIHLAVAGAAFILGNPKTRKALVFLATKAGNLHRRMGESHVERFLRKNAYTYVPNPSNPLIDIVEHPFGILGR